MPVNFSLKSNIKRAQLHSECSCWYIITAVLALLYQPVVHAEATCGKILLTSEADAASKMLAGIDELILETGFHCSIDIVNSAAKTDAAIDTYVALIETNEPAFASTAVTLSGQPGNSVETSANTTLTLNPVNANPITDTQQGWWITPDAAEKHPELTTVLDVLEHPELFVNSEESTEGLFFGCPINSDCHYINNNLFRAFEMEKKGWKLIIPDNWISLEESISNAVNNGKNWFGYYWSPSAIVGKHGMVKLDFEIEFAGTKNWHGCIAKSECDDPRPTAWNQPQLHTVINDKLMRAVPTIVPAAAVEYLGTRSVPGEVVSTLLAVQTDKQLSATETARLFLVQHTDVWEHWVSADIAVKVIDSLATLHRLH